MTANRGAAFFDRDGVLIEDVGYLSEPGGIHWCAGAYDALRLVKSAGLLAIVVTNQSAVARGLCDLGDVRRVHQQMQDDLAALSLALDAIYLCPYHPDATVPEFRHPDHPDRKPNPGMLLRAIEEHRIDRRRSFLIGDRDSDTRATEAAGVTGHLLRPEEDLVTVVQTLLADRIG